MSNLKIGNVALSHLQKLNVILSKLRKDCIQCPPYIQNMYTYGGQYYIYMIPVYRLFPYIQTLTLRGLYFVYIQ